MRPEKTASRRLPANPQWHRRGLGVALAAALLSGLCVLAVSAHAKEQLLEDFAGERSFALRWPGGSVAPIGSPGVSRIRVVTGGGGDGSFVGNVQPYAPALDFSGRFVKVWVQVDDVSKLGGMEFRLSSDGLQASYFAFQVPLYADRDFNVLRDGVWTALTFSFGSARVEGTPDRSRIDSVGWFVSDRGAGAPVVAYWGSLAAVDEPSEGVVTFTFDDGYDEHHLAAKIMAKRGLRGTAYVIPDAIGAPDYLSLEQVTELRTKYRWDVAAHHETPFTDMATDDLEANILEIQRFLSEHELGAGLRHLAYPLGKQDGAVRSVVRKHFTTARIAGSGPETLPPADPHLIRVYNVTSTTSPAEVIGAARRAMENREWLILMFHWLVDDPAQATEYSIPDFRKVVRGIDALDVRVMTFTDAWNACGPLSGEPSGCPVGATPAAPGRP